MTPYRWVHASRISSETWGTINQKTQRHMSEDLKGVYKFDVQVTVHRGKFL